jgi:hypothetical protein
MRKYFLPKGLKIDFLNRDAKKDELSGILDDLLRADEKHYGSNRIKYEILDAMGGGIAAWTITDKDENRIKYEILDSDEISDNN